MPFSDFDFPCCAFKKVSGSCDEVATKAASDGNPWGGGSARLTGSLENLK